VGISINSQSFGDFVAAADYSSTGQYRAVRFNGTANQVATVATAGARADGVLQNAPSSAGVADVAYHGVILAEYGGTVDEGDLLTCDSSGRLVKSTGKADFLVAVAREAGVVGDVRGVLWSPMGAVPCVALSFQVDLASVSDADVVTTLTPGFAGEIVDMDFVVNVPVTTGSRATTLNAEIGTTDLTGGAIALTSANCTPMGAVIAATAITAANTFTATDTISIEASSTTAFAEGSGTLIVWLRAKPA
jgi:hypothetical protein